MTGDAIPSLQAELDALNESSSAKRAPGVNETLAGTTAWLRESGAVERALGLGDVAPNFTLPNALGRDVELAGLLDRGPAIIAFYRGGW